MQSRRVVVTTGTVVQTVKNWISISVSINGMNELLIVSKSQFPSLYLQSEDLSNVLQKGMPVGVRYKLLPGESPQVLSAWVGDPPEGSNPATRSPTVYDQQGVYKDLCEGGFVIHSTCGTVFVNVEEGVFFRNGLEVSTTAIANDVICFDAIALQESHGSNANYVATAAWVGSTPAVFDRVRTRVFESSDDEVQFDYSSSKLTGTVGVIPNEYVAIADAKLDGRCIKVLVFKQNFGEVCDRIHDAVKVGDLLSMHINYTNMPGRRRYWFAEKASNISDVVTVLDDESVGCGNKPDIDAGTCYSGDIVALDVSPEITLEKEVQPRFVSINFNVKCKVLRGEGVLSKHLNQYCVKTQKKKIFLSQSNFYLDEKPAANLLQHAVITADITTVQFEAVPSNSYYGFGFEALLAWIGKKPLIGSILPFLPPPKIALLEEINQVFYGVVRKLFLPGNALIEIPGLSAQVIVSESSFERSRRRNPFIITDYIRLHCCVQFKIRNETSDEPHLCVLRAQDTEVVKFSRTLYLQVRSGSLSRVPTCTNENDAILRRSLRLKNRTRKRKELYRSPDFSESYHLRNRTWQIMEQCRLADFRASYRDQPVEEVSLWTRRPIQSRW